MTPPLPLEMADPPWLELLKAERAKGRSITEIARDCGMARPSVSMLIAGTYPAQSLDLVQKRHARGIYMALIGRVVCPHLKRAIGGEECRQNAAAPLSISNIARMRQSEACRHCHLNPIVNPE